jgi:hypothetical protein
MAKKRKPATRKKATKKRGKKREAAMRSVSVIPAFVFDNDNKKSLKKTLLGG